MTIEPYPKNEMISAETAKISKLYTDGWELYDSAERMMQCAASIGNLLKTLGNVLRDPDTTPKLKNGQDDIRLILYLDRIEDQLSGCADSLTACEVKVRSIRDGLVKIDYKLEVPLPECEDKPR